MLLNSKLKSIIFYCRIRTRETNLVELLNFAKLESQSSKNIVHLFIEVNETFAIKLFNGKFFLTKHNLLFIYRTMESRKKSPPRY